MKFSRILFLPLIATIMVSCGGHKKVVTHKDETSERHRHDIPRVTEERREEASAPQSSYAYTVEKYIETYGPIAQEEMKLYHIPASITLAQGILESGAGNSELTRRANNHFGIKCHDWNGDKVYHDDDRRNECFRKYKYAKYSFRDHSLFLADRPRYAELFELEPDDYKGWAHGLRKAGYATDRHYPDKLIDLIEKYQLYQYDEQVPNSQISAYASNESKPQQTSVSGSEVHTVVKGDTLYSIAKRYNTTVDAIKRTNGLNGNNISIGQVLNIK